ncbi:MAG: SpoIIE family protein phosphatase [Deltaproteobacteria bacterium]|jgi:serine phosphatase RsbU (regulator of sigma subunit)|nr:SpoIIE family protein phosphatase [Deltaproteobacteria bacterium]
MKDKVLLVDDDAMVLAGLKRQLRNQFRIDTALSGEEALKHVQEKGPYAVIVSDFMMPGMNGIEFLTYVKKSSPDTVRMMLTGTADMPTAIRAVNEGNIFQFHPKPCPADILSRAIQSAIQKYHKAVSHQQQLNNFKSSLEKASKVQHELLPKSDPVFDGFDIAGRSIWCDETGGDYYDFLYPPTNGQQKIGIVVGDVTDHGIPSALLMTTARAFLRERIQTSPSACASIISDVNKRLVQDVEQLNLFMTMFYCEIDAQEKSIRWVKAGHEPAILWTPTAADSPEFLAGKGLPLGVMQDAVYEEYQQQISSGQIILIGTDGIKEAINESGEMFGTQRLVQVIKDTADQPAIKIVDGVFESLDRFCSPVKNGDDATLVVIKVQ